MIVAIDHIGLAVHNLEQSATFLQQAAEFAAERVSAGRTPEGAAIERVLLRGPRCTIELLECSKHRETVYRPVNEAGITHFCVQTDQVAPLYQQFAAAGATFHAAPLQLATGNMYCYARDLEANVIEIEALPHAPANQPPWIAHVALATPDVDRLASFYHAILGGTRAGGQLLGPNPLYDQLTALQDMRVIPSWVIGKNITIELWQFLTPATLPAQQPQSFDLLGYNHICMLADDVAAALRVLQEAGAYDATPIQAADGVASAYIRDPDGNWLEVVEGG